MRTIDRIDEDEIIKIMGKSRIGELNEEDKMEYREKFGRAQVYEFQQFGKEGTGYVSLLELKSFFISLNGTNGGHKLYKKK